MKTDFFSTAGEVRIHIRDCQRDKHIQQVAYSTYHDALTQVCFTCEKIRTSINQEEIKGEKLK